MDGTNKRKDRSRLVPQVKLLREQGDIMVMAADNDKGLAFDPFPMPPVAMSMLNWLSGLGQAAYEQTERCMGVLLMLDTEEKHWAIQVPRQRCSHDGACWRVDRRDFPDMPDSFRLAGTFQTTRCEPEELHDALPPIDGLHVILPLNAPEFAVACWVRSNGELFMPELCETVFNDFSLLLRTAMKRMKLV